MKFPRNARIFRGQLDAAPFAAVLFLLVIFLMLTARIYTPGVVVHLPVAEDLPGTDRPTIEVAIDSNGRLYFENQGILEADLRGRLRQKATEAKEPLTLIVEADKNATTEMLLHLELLARGVGITNSLLATLPRPFGAAP